MDKSEQKKDDIAAVETVKEDKQKIESLITNLSGQSIASKTWKRGSTFMVSCG